MPVLALALVALCNEAKAIQKSTDQSSLNSLVGLDDAVIDEHNSISRQKLPADHLHRPAPMAAPAKAKSFVDLDEQTALEAKLAAVKQRTCSEYKVCDHPEAPENEPQARFLLSTDERAVDREPPSREMMMHHELLASVLVLMCRRVCVRLDPMA